MSSIRRRISSLPALLDQVPAFWRHACFSSDTPDIDESGLSEFGGVVVFAFGRRDAVLVLVAVFIAEDSQIDVTALHFFEINLVRTAVLGRKFLKEKDFGNETVEEGIAEKKGLQVLANLLKLLLNAADEYLQTYRLHLHPSQFLRSSC